MFPGPRNNVLRGVCIVFMTVLIGPYLAALGQVIEFTSNGLEYMTLSRGGLTLMYAPR